MLSLNSIDKLFLCTPFAFLGCTDHKEINNNKNEKMNVVFILADDMGYSQLGCNGSEYYETPNIDKLSSESLNFTNAYSAAAVSSPTRASIMTGKYPARLHITDFIKGDTFPDSSLITPNWQKYLPLEEHTLGELFKENGYLTAIFGKWHLSIDKHEPASKPFNPDKQGFDEYIVTHKPGASADSSDDAHNVKLITEKSVNFLNKMRDTSFFLFVSHNSIHDPLMEDSILVNKYRHKKGVEKSENHPIIGAMIETLDKGVGEILNAIDSLGLSQNTVVIFYGDNGGKDLYASQTPFRKGKGWLYEGGIRVPLMIKWPGLTRQGEKTEQVISSIDFYPTFADYLEDSSIVDGISLINFLMPNTPIAERRLFWNYPHYHRGSGMKPAAAVLDGNYKAIIWYEEYLKDSTKGIELYNLSNDASEENNIFKDSTELAFKLLNEFNLWAESANIQIPEVKH
jgi:uncharacterized sulfatase